MHMAQVFGGGVEPLRVEGGGWAEVLDALQTVWPVGRSTSTVWLSGSLARPFVLEPVSGINQRSEALLLAEAQAPEATGLAGPCVVWLGPWQSGAPSLAVAIDRHLLDGVQAWASRCGTRLNGLRPWWESALNERWAQTQTGMLCSLEDEDALLMIGMDGERIHMATSYCPAPDNEERTAMLQRAMLSGGLSESTVHRGLRSAAGAPAHSAPSPTAVRWLEGA